ncbi:MAG: ATP-dependent helicase, partial [Lachnospiraceae bacterium]|nr:ATP-dependent helicase [Lachnospiraceae bacterium]
MNEAQKAAVLHGEGPAFVAAGPGSGKTTVIVRRLLYLIQERRIPPQQILVITFTKEAALTMQKRFQEQSKAFCKGQTQSKGFVSFGTFHSFFYQIIKSIHKYSEYQLITQQEKYRIVKSVLQKDTKEEVTENNMNQLLTQVSFYKNTGEVSREDSTNSPFEKETARSVEEEQKHFLSLMEQYENTKAKYQKIDFDDMLYLCKKELESDSKLRNIWQKRYSYILIDEYQDINPIQREIIQLLVAAPHNLFVVGDDDQAIYGFRGSEADVFRKFIEDYPNAAQITLAENYRCGENIVKASRSLIEHNKQRVRKELASVNKSAAMGQIRAYGAVSTKECYESLALRMKEIPIRKLEEEAVLFRTNSAMQMFAAILSRYHIPFVLREKVRCIYEHFLMKDLEDYFLAASGCRERVVFLHLFQRMRVPLGRE